MKHLRDLSDDAAIARPIVRYTNQPSFAEFVGHWASWRVMS